MSAVHDAGRWHTLSIAAQLGNIGSEISRARLAEGRSVERFDAACARALELVDLTLSDPRWTKRRGELGRVREVVADAILGGREYQSTFMSIQPYFDRYALLAQTGV